MSVAKIKGMGFVGKRGASSIDKKKKRKTHLHLRGFEQWNQEGLKRELQKMNGVKKRPPQTGVVRIHEPVQLSENLVCKDDEGHFNDAQARKKRVNSNRNRGGFLQKHNKGWMTHLSGQASSRFRGLERCSPESFFEG